jgi:hypothetical protein
MHNSDALGAIAECPPLNVAVFANGDDLVLVHLEHPDADGASTEAVSRGYAYAGCIGINGGEPKALIEPGFEATLLYAGVLFAEMAGKHLQDYQLRIRRASGEETIGA